jgi:hypothetical protein
VRPTFPAGVSLWYLGRDDEANPVVDDGDSAREYK